MKQSNTQENKNVESLSHFVERSQADALEKIEQLTGFLRNQRFDGLGFVDFSAKIVFEEGRLEVLQHVAWLVDQEADLK